MNVLGIWSRLQREWQRLREMAVWRWGGWAVAVALGAAALAVGLVYRSGQQWGPGATTDGLTYMLLARNLRRFGAVGFLRPGGGWEPVTLWPPGYPLLMAWFMRFTQGNEVQAARWVNLIFLGALVGLLVRELWATLRHVFPVALATLWLATAFPLLRMYAWVHSEAVFLVQVLLVAWAMAAWRRSPTMRRAVLTGLLVAWAVTVRWIGVALFPWVLSVTWWWVRRRPALRQRLWPQAVGFLAAAGVPVVALLWASRTASGKLASRTVGWHPPSAAKWHRAAETVVSWVTPPFQKFSTTALVGGALLLLVGALGLGVWAWWKARQEPLEEADRIRGFLWQWGTWAFWYWAVLLVAMTLVEPGVWMHLRILSPVFLAFGLVVGVGLWQVLARHWWGFVVLLYIFARLLQVNKAYDAFFLWRKWYNQGALLLSRAVQTADMWPALRDLPPQVTLYSNKWRETYFYTDRPANPLICPSEEDEEAWVTNLAQQLEGQCAVLALIAINTTVDQDAQVQCLQRLLAPVFPLDRSLESGLIFRAPRATCFP